MFTKCLKIAVFIIRNNIKNQILELNLLCLFDFIIQLCDFKSLFTKVKFIRYSFTKFIMRYLNL